MTGDRLREAASLLRERAEAVDGWYTAKAWATASPMSLPIEPADAAYIATMSPPVALALAEFLEQHESIHSVYDCNWEPCAASAVANAILGDPS